LVESAKGSVFVLCDRSRTDRSFPRYPPLPVVGCIGYQAVAPTTHGEASG
jgi:hypothetical protein